MSNLTLIVILTLIAVAIVVATELYLNKVRYGSFEFKKNIKDILKNVAKGVAITALSAGITFILIHLITKH